MPGSAPVQLIHHASHRVRLALRHWKGTDLSCVAECRGLLEDAVADLKASIDLLRQGAFTVPGDLPAMIASLRRDISTMIRLVDACAAFDRAMSADGRAAGPSYDKSGQPVGEPSVALPTCVLG